MKTRFKFVPLNQNFEYKRTVFQKVSKGKIKCLHTSLSFVKDKELNLPPNTWVSFNKKVEFKPIQLKLF